MFRCSLALSTFLVASAGWITLARAQTPGDAPPDASNEAPADARAAPPNTTDETSDSSESTGAESKLDEVIEKNAELAARVDDLEAERDWANERIDQLMQVKNRVSGYIDFGFFAVQGDGRGIRTDLGHARLPEYSDVPDSWVFMGDPLSTAINSRGDPADVAESRAITFDPIGNRGEPSFILNSVNVQLFAGVGEDLTVNASFDLLPRARDISNPDGAALGDYVDVKLGYIDYRIELGSTLLSLYAGKFDSVLGYEYRIQESTTRTTVTPSLICRYICGRPLGLKARWQALDDALVVNASLTNGSHFSESFDFADEVDANAGKTLALRLSYLFPLGTGIELGASAAYGTQDAQTEADPRQWHAGFDVHGAAGDLNFTAEVAKGKAEGADEAGEPLCGVAPCIRYQGGYVLLAYRLTNWMMPYVRGDYREAVHRSGASFVYHSELARATGGVRFDLGTHIIIKGEYTHNRELGPIPQFDNDVLTSSLVARW